MYQKLVNKIREKNDLIKMMAVSLCEEKTIFFVKVILQYVFDFYSNHKTYYNNEGDEIFSSFEEKVNAFDSLMKIFFNNEKYFYFLDNGEKKK